MTGVFRRLPLLSVLADYTASAGRADLVAGLTVAVMLVPQSMAYAALAGMPPEAGLYAALVPVLAYAILGTSGQLAVGPVAIVALLTAEAVGPLAAGDPIRYALAAAALAVMVGAVQVALGLVRAGRLVRLLSHGVISGFTSAAAIVIAFSQIPALLGLEVTRREHFVDRVAEVVAAIGGTHVVTLIIGLAGIALLVGARVARRRIPGPLLLVVAATAVVAAWGLDEAGVAVLGTVPAGLPAPSLPSFDASLLAHLAPAAATIAILSYAEGVSVAKAIAIRTEQHIDPDQELLAVGTANLAAGFFGAFPVAGGFSRSAVNYEAGARTTVASLVTAAVIALTAVAFTPLFTHLPKAVLAAIVVVAVLGLVDVRTALATFRIRRLDGVVLAVTFGITLLVGIEIGLAAGVVASMLVFVARSSRPHLAELGRVGDSALYRNVERWEVATDPRVMIVRVDGPLFFANAAGVAERLAAEMTDRPELEALVVDAAAVADIDADGLHALERLGRRASDTGVRLMLATVRGPVRDLLDRSGVWSGLGAAAFHPDVASALRAWDPEAEVTAPGDGLLPATVL